MLDCNRSEMREQDEGWKGVSHGTVAEPGSGIGGAGLQSSGGAVGQGESIMARLVKYFTKPDRRKRKQVEVMLSIVGEAILGWLGFCFLSLPLCALFTYWAEREVSRGAPPAGGTDSICAEAGRQPEAAGRVCRPSRRRSLAQSFA